MRQHGRKSAAETVVALPELRRPKAPEDLEPVAAAEWDRVVGRMPAGFFTDETLGLLRLYCVCTGLAGRIEAQLGTCKDLGAPKAMLLLKAHERLAAQVSSLATKLRLTPQRRMLAGQVITAMERDAAAASKRPIWERRV